jgi:hypothetical protein
MDGDFGEFTLAPPPDSTKQFIRSLWSESLKPESIVALVWLFYNSLYFDMGLDRNDSVKLVRYESVVAEPEREFRRLCEFLGVGYHRVMGADVFSSSVQRDSEPIIEGEIRGQCEALLARLCAAASHNRTPESHRLAR